MKRKFRIIPLTEDSRVRYKERDELVFEVDDEE